MEGNFDGEELVFFARESGRLECGSFAILGTGGVKSVGSRLEFQSAAAGFNNAISIEIEADFQTFRVK